MALHNMFKPKTKSKDCKMNDEDDYYEISDEQDARSIDDDQRYRDIKSTQDAM